jgi:hypothetical protein
MARTMFMDIIAGKSSRDFTRPLGMPRGLKDLLHTLNTIVHPTQEGFILLFSNLFYVIYC